MPQLRIGHGCARPVLTPVKSANSFLSFILRNISLLLTEFVKLPQGLPPARFSGTGNGEAQKPRQVPVDEVVAAVVVIAFDLSSTSRFLDTVPEGGECFLFS